MGFVYNGNGQAEPQGRHVFLYGQQRESAGNDSGKGQDDVPEHPHRNLFSPLQAGIFGGRQPAHHRGHQPGQPGFAVDWHDRSETGKMGIPPLAGTAHSLSLRHHRGRVRFLCGYGEKGSHVLAGTQSGVAVPTDQRA